MTQTHAAYDQHIAAPPSRAARRYRLALVVGVPGAYSSRRPRHDLEALRCGAFAEFRGKPAIVAEAGSNARLSNAQSDRLTERVRRSLQTITDLSQFTRRDFDSLLLHVRTRLRGDGRVDKAVQLLPHVLDDMGQLGHLGCDQLYVRVLGHAKLRRFYGGRAPMWVRAKVAPRRVSRQAQLLRPNAWAASTT